MVRVLNKAAPRWITGQGAPGMSWSTVVASLRLHDGTGPRAQGQLCDLNGVASSGIPSFAGPTLSLLRRGSWDERRWSRQYGVKADSGFDAPVGVAAVLCREPEPLMMPWLWRAALLIENVDVEGSILAGLDVYASPHPHLKAITGTRGSVLSKRLIHVGGWAGGVKLLRAG